LRYKIQEVKAETERLQKQNSNSSRRITETEAGNRLQDRREDMDRTEEFKKIVAQYSNVPVEEMREDMTLREDLGLSSLDFMSFLGELEDTFDVEIDLDRAQQINTLGEALGMMREITGEE
jgi:acyl carrier protein